MRSPSLTPYHAPIFGRRLRQARLRKAMSQDQLGKKLGLDESTASTRISRYENGVHEPPVRTARDLANALNVPLGYLYCDDDTLAEIILLVSGLPAEAQKDLLLALRQTAEATQPPDPPD